MAYQKLRGSWFGEQVAQSSNRDTSYTTATCTPHLLLRPGLSISPARPHLSFLTAFGVGGGTGILKYPHCADKETVVQRGDLISPQSPSEKVVDRWGTSSGLHFPPELVAAALREPSRAPLHGQCTQPVTLPVINAPSVFQMNGWFLIGFESAIFQYLPSLILITIWYINTAFLFI